MDTNAKHTPADRTPLDSLKGYTPGPWFVVGPPWNHELPWVNSGNADPHHFMPVCDFDMRLDGEQDREGDMMADAALIAAAPELLARCEAAEKQVARLTDDNARLYRILNGATDARMGDSAKLLSMVVEYQKALSLSPHKLADEACGRKWSCGCPFCTAARAALRETEGGQK